MKNFITQLTIKMIYMQHNSKGFTLIELLIVVALLGVLAVGLLASINPFEQLRKGRDTTGKNAAAQIHAAAIRYYGARGNFPWQTSGVTQPWGGPPPVPSASSYTGTAFQGVISELTNTGELKQNFYSLAGSSTMAKISVSWISSEQFVSCFQPESKGFRSDPANKYNITGGVDAACPNATSATCYTCFQ